MPEVLVGLGGNLGDPEANLRFAVTRLAGIMVLDAVSSLYRAEPVGMVDQPDFLNAALRGRSERSPAELLDTFLALERERGRERTASNGPRTLDLDLLFYGDAVLDEPGLTVPHPRLTARRFVLLPLMEIAPTAVHPVNGRTVAELLGALQDPARVERLDIEGWPPAIGG